jgi:hypothetical protein
LLLAEDNSEVIDELLMVCQDWSLLPRVLAMIPARYEYTLAAELDTLIHGWKGVVWYHDADLGNSVLLREAVWCSEARRKAKAFSAPSEGVMG